MKQLAALLALLLLACSHAPDDPPVRRLAVPLEAGPDAPTDAQPDATPDGDAGTDCSNADQSESNFVFVMYDDLDVPTLAQGLTSTRIDPVTGERVLDGFRQIVADGITFSNSYVLDSVCSPSRATFMSGKPSHAHGVDGCDNNSIDGWLDYDDAHWTVAEMLREADVYTAVIGKLINGYNQTVWLPGWDYLAATKYSTQSRTGPGDWWLFTTEDEGQNWVQQTPNEHQARHFGELAVGLVQSMPDRFFMWVNYFEPHVKYPDNTVGSSRESARKNRVLPFPESSDNCTFRALQDGGTCNDFTPASGFDLPSIGTCAHEEDVSDKPPWMSEGITGTEGPYPQFSGVFPGIGQMRRQHADRLASLLEPDRQVQAMIAALKNECRYENTIICIGSDNGHQEGAHGLTRKRYVYEGSIRVPLFCKPVGDRLVSQWDGVVTNADWSRTLVDLFGADDHDEGLTGQSLAAILAPKRQILIEHKQRTGGGLHSIPDYRALAAPDRKHTLYERQTEGGLVLDREYYDLTTDPHECEADDSERAALEDWIDDAFTAEGAEALRLERQVLP